MKCKVDFTEIYTELKDSAARFLSQRSLLSHRWNTMTLTTSSILTQKYSIRGPKSVNAARISSSGSTCLGKTIHTRKYGINAARPAISLNLKACFIPLGSSAPKNCVRYMDKRNQVLDQLLQHDRQCDRQSFSVKYSVSEQSAVFQSILT